MVDRHSVAVPAIDMSNDGGRRDTYEASVPTRKVAYDEVQSGGE